MPDVFVIDVITCTLLQFIYTLLNTLFILHFTSYSFSTSSYTLYKSTDLILICLHNALIYHEKYILYLLYICAFMKTRETRQNLKLDKPVDVVAPCQPYWLSQLTGNDLPRRNHLILQISFLGISSAFHPLQFHGPATHCETTSPTTTLTNSEDAIAISTFLDVTSCANAQLNGLQAKSYLRDLKTYQHGRPEESKGIFALPYEF